MMWIVLSVAIVALGYYLLTKPLTYWTKKGVPQGNPIIFFGDNWGPVLRLQSFAEMVTYIYNLRSNVRYFGFYQFSTPTLLIKDLDLIKQMTVKDFDHFTDHRPFVPEDADPLWGKNLLALSGKKWRDMRATLSPSFTSSKMKYMFTLISETAENFVDYFKNLNQNEIEVELKDTFTRFTNDVIATTAFGIKVDSLSKKDNAFYLMGKKATNFNGFFAMMKFFAYFSMPNVMRFFKVKLFDDDVREFFVDLIKESIRVREEKGIVRHDMINLLMEARKGTQKIDEDPDTIDRGFAVAQESEIGKRKDVNVKLEDIDIAAQAMIFFFAGFETVSSLMCFLGYELAVNPEVQTRLRQEIRDTLKECNGKLTYEAVLKMQYLDMVISETLRKWPGAVAVDRVCTKPYTIKATKKGEVDVHLPTGSVIWVPVFPIHHDPKIYPDPEKFDPERFNDANKTKINPYNYSPFGLGPRNCIGSRFALLEIKTVFFHILNSFEIVPCAKSVIPVRICKTQFNLNAADGFWFNLKRLAN